MLKKWLVTYNERADELTRAERITLTSLSMTASPCGEVAIEPERRAEIMATVKCNDEGFATLLKGLQEKKWLAPLIATTEGRALTRLTHP